MCQMHQNHHTLEKESLLYSYYQSVLYIKINKSAAFLFTIILTALIV